MLHPDQSINPDQVLPIVVGAHLRAELGDRPRAEKLCCAITNWMKENDIEGPPWPLVCTDLWYLNNVELRTQPTICIGHPEVNAATAALSPKLPTAVVKSGAYRIQLDREYLKLNCCMWGIDDLHANKCLEAFMQSMLQKFIGAIFGIRVEI